ncbi:hypothetical protein AOLI_G00233950 [Acnodon oligacanthus]
MSSDVISREDGEVTITIQLMDSGSCSKAVGTDLTMTDIGTLEDLQSENVQLRRLVASLEARLKQWSEEGEQHSEGTFQDLQNEDSRDQLTVQELEDEPSLLSVLKAEPHPKEITSFVHAGGDDKPSLLSFTKTEVTAAETKDAVCENEKENQHTPQNLPENPSLSSVCKTEPNQTEIPCHTYSEDEQQAPLDLCAVRPVDGKKSSNAKSNAPKIPGEPSQLGTNTEKSVSTSHPVDIHIKPHSGLKLCSQYGIAFAKSSPLKRYTRLPDETCGSPRFLMSLKDAFVTVTRLNLAINELLVYWK